MCNYTNITYLHLKNLKFVTLVRSKRTMIIGAIPGAKKPQVKKEQKDEEKKDSKDKNSKREEDFDPNDHRLFIGNLDKKVTDTQLHQAFAHYASLLKVKVAVDNRTGQSRGYGFVSLGEAEDARRVLKEMQAKYVGAKPIKVVRSKNKNQKLNETD